MKNTIRFSTVFFEVITISVLMAHLLEMPAKMILPMESYQLVQGIYYGWAWLCVFEIAAIAGLIAWLVIDRKKSSTRKFLIASLALFIVSLSVFLAVTYPANSATQDWTVLPNNWEELRKQWEYSNAIRAGLNLTGFSLLVLALVRKRKSGYRRMPTRIIPASAKEFYL